MHSHALRFLSTSCMNMEEKEKHFKIFIEKYRLLFCRHSCMSASMLQAGQSLMPVHFRWATETEEQPFRSAGSKRALAQGQGPSKRAKAQGAAAETDDFDGLTAGLDGFFGKKQGRRGMHDNAKPTRGVLKKVMPMHLPGLEHMIITMIYRRSS